MQCHPDFFSDLKPNNVVLTEDGQVRLIDFGLADCFRTKTLQVLHRQVAHYSAPEVFKKEPAGLASDWFPYGVIIAYLYQLKHPIEGSSPHEIQTNAQNGNLNIDCMPQKAKEFIEKLLVVDPNARLTSVSSDEFFKTITEFPFQPKDVKAPAIIPSGKAQSTADDPMAYSELESSAIRIPPADFFETKYYKSIK